jgi:hypothetical protein
VHRYGIAWRDYTGMIPPEVHLAWMGRGRWVQALGTPDGLLHGEPVLVEWEHWEPTPQRYTEKCGPVILSARVTAYAPMYPDDAFEFRARVWDWIDPMQPTTAVDIRIRAQSREDGWTDAVRLIGAYLGSHAQQERPVRLCDPFYPGRRVPMCVSAPSLPG